MKRRAHVAIRLLWLTNCLWWFVVFISMSSYRHSFGDVVGQIACSATAMMFAFEIVRFLCGDQMFVEVIVCGREDEHFLEGLRERGSSTNKEVDSGNEGRDREDGERLRDGAQQTVHRER